MINLTKFGRFFIGSGVGAVLDFGVGASLIFFGASLSVATVVGFTAAILLTYWLHLRWTFNMKDSSFVSRHLVRFALSSIFTLFVRLSVLFLGKSFIALDNIGQKDLLLVIAIGFSFCVNYAISTLWSFSTVKRSQ